MTGHHDRHSIATIGESHRTTGRRLSERGRNLTVSSCLAEWNLLERLPYRHFKLAARSLQWNSESLQLSREVLCQLIFDSLQVRIRSWCDGVSILRSKLLDLCRKRRTIDELEHD